MVQVDDPSLVREARRLYTPIGTLVLLPTLAGVLWFKQFQPRLTNYPFYGRVASAKWIFPFVPLWLLILFNPPFMTFRCNQLLVSWHRTFLPEFVLDAVDPRLFCIFFYPMYMSGMYVSMLFQHVRGLANITTYNRRLYGLSAILFGEAAAIVYALQKFGPYFNITTEDPVWDRNLEWCLRTWLRWDLHQDLTLEMSYWRLDWPVQPDTNRAIIHVNFELLSWLLPIHIGATILCYLYLIAEWVWATQYMPDFRVYDEQLRLIPVASELYKTRVKRLDSVMGYWMISTFFMYLIPPFVMWQRFFYLEAASSHYLLGSYLFGYLLDCAVAWKYKEFATMGYY